MQFLKKQTTKDRYGNETTYEFENQVKPLDQTEIMKMMMEQGVPQMPQGIPQMPMQQQAQPMQQQAQQGHPGGPKGTDTVPAWLTPGEFVMNAKAVDKFGPQIEAMNNEGREEQGAQVPQMGGQEAQYHADGGEVTPEHIPDEGEIARYQAALNEASGNATSSARVVAAFKDGEFRNAVAPEVQYEVPSMLDRVPQEPSQAKSFTNIGEEAIGPIPTVPAQAEVPNTSSATSIPEGGDEYGSMNSDELVDADRNTVAARAFNRLSGDLSNDSNSISNFVSGALRNNPFSWNKTADEGAAAIEDLNSRFRDGRLSKKGYDLALAQINEEIAAGEVRAAGNLKADQKEVKEAADREAFLSANTEEPIAEVPPANVSPDGVPPINKPPVVLTKPEDNGFTPYDKNLDLESEVNEVDKTVNSDPKSVQEKGESLGKKTDKDGVTWYEKAYDSIGGALGNLIDSDRLAEATVMYLGSRAMGYSHDGSLGFVSKQYLGGIKADQAAVRAAAADKSKRGLDMKDFREKETIKANLDAAAKGIANGQIKVDRTKLITIADTNGKKSKVYAAVDGAGNKSYTDTNGKPIDTTGYETEQSNIKDTPEYRARVETTSKSFAKVFNDIEAREGSFRDEEGNVTYTTGIIPSAAGREAVDWAVTNNVPQEQIGGLLQSAYMDAINFAKASGTTPSDIRPFLNQLVIRKKSGADADLFALKTDDKKAPKQYVDAGKLAVVNSTIAKALADSGKSGSVEDIASQYYDNMVPRWNKLSPDVREKWESRANDGENGFYVFIADQLGITERKVK